MISVQDFLDRMRLRQVIHRRLCQIDINDVHVVNGALATRSPDCNQYTIISVGWKIVIGIGRYGNVSSVELSADDEAYRCSASLWIHDTHLSTNYSGSPR